MGEHDFNRNVKDQAWMRQNGKCACCGKDLVKQAHKLGEQPNYHHAVPQQSSDEPRKQDPWMSSEKNCVVVCDGSDQDGCHYKVHDGGKFRDGAVYSPDNFKYSHGDYDNDPEARRKHEEWSKEVNEKWDEKHERYKSQNPGASTEDLGSQTEEPDAPRKSR